MAKGKVYGKTMTSVQAEREVMIGPQISKHGYAYGHAARADPKQNHHRVIGRRSRQPSHWRRVETL